MKVRLPLFDQGGVKITTIEAKILDVLGPEELNKEDPGNNYEIKLNKNYWDTRPKSDVPEGANREGESFSYDEDVLLGEILPAFNVDKPKDLIGKTVTVVYGADYLSNGILNPAEPIIFEK